MTTSENKKWDRIRFYANDDDYRPVIWPPVGPYWFSGQGHNYSVIVAFFPTGFTDEDIKKFWPEATNIQRMQTNTDLTFYDRFAQPDWWPIKE